MQHSPVKNRKMNLLSLFFLVEICQIGFIILSDDNITAQWTQDHGSGLKINPQSIKMT